MPTRRLPPFPALLNNTQRRAVCFWVAETQWRQTCDMHRSKETQDCGTRWSIHHSRWVRRLTSTVWVCLDSAETNVTHLPLPFIQHGLPTGCSSALRIRTTTTVPDSAVAESLDGGLNGVQDRCWIMTPTPSGMQTLMRIYSLCCLPACWWNSIDVDLQQHHYYEHKQEPWAPAGMARGELAAWKCLQKQFWSLLTTSIAQLSQRDRAAGWVSYGQTWKTGTGRQYF